MIQSYIIDVNQKLLHKLQPYYSRKLRSERGKNKIKGGPINGPAEQSEFAESE